jgi:hypothetical protein
MPLYTKMPDAMAFRVPCNSAGKAYYDTVRSACLRSSETAGARCT